MLYECANIWSRCLKENEFTPESKQHVINIDIALWQQQTTKFLSVTLSKHRQRLRLKYTLAHTITLLCQQKTLSDAESLYCKRKRHCLFLEKGGKEKKYCHKATLDSFPGTWLSILVLLQLALLRIWIKKLCKVGIEWVLHNDESMERNSNFINEKSIL